MRRTLKMDFWTYKDIVVSDPVHFLERYKCMYVRYKYENKRSFTMRYDVYTVDIRHLRRFSRYENYHPEVYFQHN